MKDDSFLPDLPDLNEDATDPSARAIVQCLRILAGEATTLGLARTLAALKAAIQVCADEGETGETEQPDPNDLLRRTAASSRLH